ncbi:Ethanolamine ammonia-lyase light chain [Acetobacter tropicalis]|uniref:Ethanolamine ammonia-lyase light chain n=1 Tax=Acetobacter tropicalis TaxID=104102 RepID=A0A094YT15_9PROT|nr:Ethanolamine ammonia-lyase light chain [Acetobacter tropicalis]
MRRPDLGRRLDGPSIALLKQIAPAGPWDVVLVAADGLSAVAVERQAPPLQNAVRAALAHTWRIAPLVVAHNARVALGDEIGALLGVRCVVMMIGERPGLSVSDSLSLYMTWNPHVGRQDSERNCISNIHARGLSIGEGCHKLCWLLKSARKLGYTGVALKDESTNMTLLPETKTP